MLRVYFDTNVYDPTQIVSEFFRLRFSDTFGAIDGIRFRSSRCDQGVCVCLFLTNQDFLENRSKLPLQLLDVRRRTAVKATA